MATKDGDMNSTKDSPKGRTTTRPLTGKHIQNLPLGQQRSDGRIAPGAGALLIRRRGDVREWMFRYVAQGHRRAMTLAPWSANERPGYLTLAQARDEARRLGELVRRGLDPLVQRSIEAAKAAEQQQEQFAQVREDQEQTFGKLLEAYVSHLESSGRQARTARDARGMFHLHVRDAFPELWGAPAASVKAEQIARVLGRLVGPDAPVKKGSTARKLRAYMRRAFELARGASLDPTAARTEATWRLSGNPAADVPARPLAAFNRPGERVLSRNELRAYLAHLASLDSLQGAFLRVQVFLGGQRVAQLARLRWSDVRDGRLTLRDGKGRRAEARLHELPLLPEVADILDALPHGESGLVFESQAGKELDATVLSATVRDIALIVAGDDASAEAFRHGDIRRTVESMMAEIGVSKDLRAQLLSHGLGGVQDRHYDRADYMPQKAVALRRWCDFLADLCIGPEDAGNVIPLRGAA